VQIEYRPLSDIKPYPKNARRIPQAAIDAVAKSIQEFGWRQPIVVDKEGVIVVGHVRLKVTYRGKFVAPEPHHIEDHYYLVQFDSAPPWQKPESVGFTIDRSSDSWDKDQCLREFRRALESRDSWRLERAILALDRLNCWHEALGQLLNENGPKEALGAALLSFWTWKGSHIATSLQGDWIPLIDALKHLLPPYSGSGRKLYRGELESRRADGKYGMAWTPCIESAGVFARRRFPNEGRGVVLEIDATPEMIIAGPTAHSSSLGEDEYVIDPRLIQAVRVVE